MQRSSGQKVLTVVAVLEFLGAVFNIVLSVLAVWALAGALESEADLNRELASLVSGSTILADMNLGIRDIVLIISFVAMFAAMLDVVLGVLCLRAAYNPLKVMPVWIISLLSVVFGVLGVILLIVQGNRGGGSLWMDLLALAVDIITFVAANSVRKQARSMPPAPYYA